MKNWIIKNKLYFIGAIAGALVGYLYWKYAGCLDGTCSITSSPIKSTLYFSLMGGLLFGMFRKGTKNPVAVDTHETDH